MGATPSKEELLYQEVQKGNHDAVKAYRRDGASLEWVDKVGRTPLILACTRCELLDMAITLLNLGASIHTYRPGPHGGFPLHHAAKKGLEKTVILLLSRGADPFTLNDDGHTPLEVARRRGHVSVVRLLEEKISIFSGMLRELSGPGFLESLVPNLCTKKIWAVVVPIDLFGRRARKYELAIYTSPKVSVWNGIRPSTSHPAGLCNVAQPRTVIQLSKVEIGEPKFSTADPILYIIDKATKTRYKFLSEKEGDKAQLRRFHKACKGNSQVQHGAIQATPEILALPVPAHLHGNSCQVHPVARHQNRPNPSSEVHLHHGLAASNISSPCKSSTSATDPMSDDLELALALDASIRSATEEGVPISPTSSLATSLTDYVWQDDVDRSYSRWCSPDFKNWKRNAHYGGLGEKEAERSYDMWELGEAGTSGSLSPNSSSGIQSDSPKIISTFTSRNNMNKPKTIQATSGTSPSAPPLPDTPVGDNYCISNSSVAGLAQINFTSADKIETGKVNGTCVVCWDAPAEGACVPCGHMASCMSCLSEISIKNWGCPVCRAPIEQMIKVYAV